MHSLHSKKDAVSLFFENYPRQDVVRQVVEQLDGLQDDDFRDGVLGLLFYMFLSPFAMRYPPPASYRLRVISDVIKNLEGGGREVPELAYRILDRGGVVPQLEGGGREVPELAYRMHGQLSGAPDAADTDGYVVYQLTATASVVLWENRCLLAADTTGLRTWQAGKALLDWYLLRPEGIRGRRVLELGAGLGLAGLALCRLCEPESYHITDGHPMVVEMLKHNVRINLDLADAGLRVADAAACAAFVSDAADGARLPAPCRGPADGGAPDGDLSATLCGTRLTAGTLDWFSFCGEDAGRLDVDLVLAADVTYNPELHAPLVRTLRLLLDHVTPAPEVLLALTDRNEVTTARLMSELADQGLRQKLLATPANNQSSFLMDEVSKVKVFHIERAPHQMAA